MLKFCRNQKRRNPYELDYEKIISIMFPVSVRRHSLFTLYIHNFLHILLLEYMLQKASPQGETTPCGLML